MNKRKFSLGEIVSKLNQENANHASSAAENTPSQNVKDSQIAQTKSAVSNEPDKEIVQPLSQTAPGLPQQPDFNQLQSQKWVPDRNSAKTPAIEKGQPSLPPDLHENAASKQVHSDSITNPAIAQKHENVHSGQATTAPIHDPVHTSPSFQERFRSDDPDDEEESLDIFKYIGIILRRRYVIIVIALLSGLFSLYRYSTSEKFYNTSARLLFSPDFQDLTNDYRFFAYQMDKEKQLNTHLELLRSPTVLSMVAENIGNELLSEDIAAGLTIMQGETNGEKNDIIELSYKNADPEMARDVLNELCRTYIEYRREVNTQEVSRLLSKLELQINKLQKELTSKENDLRYFKEDNQMVQLSSETNITVSKLSEMELSIQKTNLDIIENRERQQQLKSQISNQELNIVQSMTFSDPFKNRLSALELELNTLSAEYSPEHFKVKSIKEQIERLKNATIDSMSREAASQTLIKNPIRQSMVHEMINLTIEISALETKRIAQEKIIERLNSELLKLPQLEQRYIFLQRETESSLQTLRILKSKFEETKIRKDSQESDLKVLEMAQTPVVPIRKVKFTIIIIGLLAGIIIGIALAFVIEFLDQSLKDPLEVEKTLELPLLGIVPHIEADQDLFEQKDLTKNILEPFRALRANLKHIATTHRLKTFIICSAVKGEGKTTLSANLAITFAMDGKKVILIDADLRRSQMHTLFNIPKKTGLADYLLGSASVEDILKPTKYENLFIITSGERPSNPAELLGTWRFDTLIEELRARGDFVIFDSPALLPVSDTITMAPKMDGCLLVVRTLWTPLKAAKQAKNQLKRIGCRIFGGILNGVVHSKGYYPYYYGYYGYYSYKYTYDEDTPRKFSIRQFGLNVERNLKNQLRSLWFGIPKVIARTGIAVHYIFSKPLFWILLVIAIGLLFLKIFSGAENQPVSDQTIEYLGTRLSDQQQDSSMVYNDIANIDRKYTYTPKPVVTEFIDSIGLKDSIRLWLEAKEQLDTARLFSFYHPDFKFPGGTLDDLKKINSEIISNNQPGDIQYILTEAKEKNAGNNFIEISMGIKKMSAREIIETTVAMIWKKNNSQWRIIREQFTDN
ncbi:MAG TPA: polysaccharide biosynthesis tyrosine autokinase [Chitinispirillaceae bacterium]|nr:polysaccharide biosynthesis tyrosine autokinase [Chitinispirillaceae bacterium]